MEESIERDSDQLIAQNPRDQLILKALSFKRRADSFRSGFMG